MRSSPPGLKRSATACRGPTVIVAPVSPARPPTSALWQSGQARDTTPRRTRHTRIRRVTSSPASSAWLKGRHQELTVVRDLVTAISVGSW